MSNCAVDTIFERPYKSACPLCAVWSTRTTWNELMASNEAATISSTYNGQCRELALEGIGIIRTNDSCSILTDGIHLRTTFSEASKVVSAFTRAISQEILDRRWISISRISSLPIADVGYQVLRPAPFEITFDTPPTAHGHLVTTGLSYRSVIIWEVVILLLVIHLRRIRPSQLRLP